MKCQTLSVDIKCQTLGVAYYVEQWNVRGGLIERNGQLSINVYVSYYVMYLRHVSRKITTYIYLLNIFHTSFFFHQLYEHSSHSLPGLDIFKISS